MIVERIRAKGPMTFEEFMRTALYEPGLGYYVSGPPRMGWTGDYFTSTDVSDLFSVCMGRQLLLCWEKAGQPESFHVLEQGAGRGHLKKGVLEWAERENAAFHQALVYHTEDINAGQDVLSEPPASAAEQPPLDVILSNELVDAFPVHLMQKHSGKIQEIYVCEREGQLYEAIGQPSCEEAATYFDHFEIPWQTYQDGWRGEANLLIPLWAHQVATRLTVPTRPKKKARFLITIDYGDKVRDLYTHLRFRGTVASYYQHQFTERPLLRPGLQDITAYVNFSAIIEEGRKHGLRLNTFTTQRKWLEDIGLNEEVAKIRKRDFAVMDQQRASNEGQIILLQWYNLRQRVKILTDPLGMGSFKVLIMRY